MKDSPIQPSAPSRDLAGWFGRVGGPLLAVGAYGALAGAEDLPAAGRTVAACGVLMAVWWITEALPLAATSLLPLVLFPLAGVLPFPQTAAPYANQFIFLFLGGFMIAAAIQRWGLHRRIALRTILAVGTRPARLVGGFMIATALLSMWISNTATTMMMLPIALSTVHRLSGRAGHASGGTEPDGEAAGDGPPATDRLGTCLMLAVAYAASIGGIGTLVGTPPNAFLAGFLQSQGIVIGFGPWMLLALPLAALLLVIAWLVLTQWVYPVRSPEIRGGRRLLRQELEAMGKLSRGEWSVLVVFVATAAAWILRTPLTRWEWLTGHVPAAGNLNDAIIALVGALALFVIPVEPRRGVFALDWESARKLPWGVLLLFGGGLSLAEAMSQSGLTRWIGSLLAQWPPMPVGLLVMAVVALVILLTEITSNLATTAALVPIIYSVAQGLHVDPVAMVVPAAIAASCAFMLPVATPPNAIVFGSGQVTIRQMIRAGVWLNLAGVLVIPAVVYLLGPRVLIAP